MGLVRPPLAPQMTVTLDGGTPLPILEVTYEAGPVDYIRSLRASLPDPSWQHVDAHGHEHRWARTGRDAMGHADALPTLRASGAHVACDGSCGTPVPTTQPEPDDDLLNRMDWLIAGPGMDGDLSDDYCEGYHITAWHCARCGDSVEPGYIPDIQAQTTGIPIQIGPPTATLVLDHDPRGDDRSYRAFDAVLHGYDDEIRGKATVVNSMRRYGVEGPEVRVYIEMAILDT
jgi:hypothetical protein